ncbi:MAG: sensor domain-containing diguanylate cyclase, partial [Mariprofundus sp.]|nr:sensor domain-containing diguanylate cyclase [Mariprofundus sp.]
IALYCVISSSESKLFSKVVAAMSSVQGRVYNELVKLLYEQLPAALLASLLVALILVIALVGHASDISLMGWSGAIIIISFARFILYSRFKKARIKNSDMRRWYLYFLAGSTAAGIVWGVAGILLLPQVTIEYQMLTALVLGGIAIGGLQSLSAMVMAYAAFITSTLFPLSVWLVLQNTENHLIVAVLLLLFTFTLLVNSRNLNLTMTNSFHLRFKNIDLIAAQNREALVREQTSRQLLSRNAILEVMATHPSLTKILNKINIMIEQETPDAKSSILLLDQQGEHLLSASAPSLPTAYNEAIHGGAIGPNAGSCGTAAYRKKLIIVEDISTDPLWADYKALAMAHGLYACWSMPICNIQKEVIGTFALYYSEPRKPKQSEIDSLKAAVYLAAIAIEHCHAEEKLRQMAHYDPLTGLPNRAMFMDRLKMGLAQARRRNHQFAILFIDLDRFKFINDTRGHKTGDRALQKVAERLLTCVREVDTVARLGGDEFTILLTNIHDRKDVEFIADKVIQLLSEPIRLAKHEYSIGASIGISMYPENGTDADTLLGKADDAMYQTKRKGGNNYTFCSETEKGNI